MVAWPIIDCGALASSPAAAEVASSAGIETLGRKVDDDALATIRGKFISPGNIAFFGVQMDSSWEAGDGITTSAILSLKISFADGAGSGTGAVPQLFVAFDRHCDSCGDSAMDLAGFSGAAADGYVAVIGGSNALPIGGLGSFNGAAQSQQIAGSDNHVSNAMGIVVVPVFAIADNTSGMSSVTAGSVHTFADGDRLEFVLAGNQVGISLNDGNGTDTVIQSVNGDFNQAAQHVLLSSSNNLIDNRMSIVIGLNDLAQQATRISVQNAMSVMKGNGF